MRTQQLMEHVVVGVAIWLLVAWTVSCIFFP